MMSDKTEMRTLGRGLFFGGLCLFFVLGSQCLSFTGMAFWGDPNIHWTPAQLAEPLSETQDRFRVSIAGKALAQHLADGTLLGVEPGAAAAPGTVADGGGEGGEGGEGAARSQHYTVVPDDVRVRVNHYAAYQLRNLKIALIFAPFAGLGIGLAIGAFLLWRRT